MSVTIRESHFYPCSAGIFSLLAPDLSLLQAHREFGYKRLECRWKLGPIIGRDSKIGGFSLQIPYYQGKCPQRRVRS